MLLPAATLPGDPDHVRRARVQVTEERLGDRVQLARRRDAQVQQPRERQVDLFDLAHRHRLAEAAQRGEVVLGQRERRRRAQPAPLLAGEVDVRIELCLFGRVHAYDVAHGYSARATPIGQLTPVPPSPQ